MAGRGTDIKLEAGVAALGGLHVIATERHESGRIDRQLFGRCARQGDPGSSQAFVSADDELVVKCIAPIEKEFLNTALRLVGKKSEKSFPPRSQWPRKKRSAPPSPSADRF